MAKKSYIHLQAVAKGDLDKDRQRIAAAWKAAVKKHAPIEQGLLSTECMMLTEFENGLKGKRKVHFGSLVAAFKNEEQALDFFFALIENDLPAGLNKGFIEADSVELKSDIDLKTRAFYGIPEAKL